VVGQGARRVVVLVAEDDHRAGPHHLVQLEEAGGLENVGEPFDVDVHGQGRVFVRGGGEEAGQVDDPAHPVGFDGVGTVPQVGDVALHDGDLGVFVFGEHVPDDVGRVHVQGGGALAGSQEGPAQVGADEPRSARDENG